MKCTKARKSEAGKRGLEHEITPSRILVASYPTGAVLLELGGCLGLNPLLLVSASAENATIMTLMNLFLTNVLGGG